MIVAITSFPYTRPYRIIWVTILLLGPIFERKIGCNEHLDRDLKAELLSFVDGSFEYMIAIFVIICYLKSCFYEENGSDNDDNILSVSENSSGMTTGEYDGERVLMSDNEGLTFKSPVLDLTCDSEKRQILTKNILNDHIDLVHEYERRLVSMENRYRKIGNKSFDNNRLSSRLVSPEYKTCTLPRSENVEGSPSLTPRIEKDHYLKTVEKKYPRVNLKRKISNTFEFSENKTCLQNLPPAKYQKT